jgi:hypothetical protein
LCIVNFQEHKVDMEFFEDFVHEDKHLEHWPRGWPY